MPGLRHGSSNGRGITRHDEVDEDDGMTTHQGKRMRAWSRWEIKSVAGSCQGKEVSFIALLVKVLTMLHGRRSYIDMFVSKRPLGVVSMQGFVPTQGSASQQFL